MKKQEKEVDAEKLLAKIEQQRSEIHNLKRQLKRRDAKLQEKEADPSSSSAISKTEEVTSKGIGEIKQKLREKGLTEKEIEVAVLFMSRK